LAAIIISGLTQVTCGTAELPRFALSAAFQKQVFLEHSKPGNRSYWTGGFKAWTCWGFLEQATLIPGALIAGNVARSAPGPELHPKLTPPHRSARN